MKILMLAAADSIHTVRWANEYAQRGHKVYLVTNADHRGKFDTFNSNIIIHYLKHTGAMAYYLNVFELKKVVSKICPDVINVCYASGYGTTARLAKLKKMVLSVWGSDVYLFPYKSALNMHIVRENLKYPKLIASTSAAMADQVRKLLPNKKLQIIETPFGINVEEFYPRLNKKQNEKFIFGTVKKLTDVYGIDIIIRAFAEFLKLNPNVADDVELQIYGKGNQAGEYRSLVKELGLEKLISIHGYVPHEQVPELISSFDVFCLGSRSESFGVSALEAMSCGLPVIATNVDGFKEVMEDEKSGFIVPVDDYIKMAQKMTVLFYDKKLRERFGKRGREIVNEKYVWKENVDIMERALSKVALS